MHALIGLLNRIILHLVSCYVTFAMRSNWLNKNLHRRASLVYENRKSLNVSTWVPTLEKDLSVMEPGKNPYEDRQIGVRKKPDWVGKKCASCAKGFNRVSKPLQCLALWILFLTMK